MPSQPLSLRKTRQVVSHSVDVLNSHATSIDALNAAVRDLARACGSAKATEAILRRPFLGRLRWLVLGR